MERSRWLIRFYLWLGEVVATATKSSESGCHVVIFTSCESGVWLGGVEGADCGATSLPGAQLRNGAINPLQYLGVLAHKADFRFYPKPFQ